MDPKLPGPNPPGDGSAIVPRHHERLVGNDFFREYTASLITQSRSNYPIATYGPTTGILASCAGSPYRWPYLLLYPSRLPPVDHRECDGLRHVVCQEQSAQRDGYTQSNAAQAAAPAPLRRCTARTLGRPRRRSARHFRLNFGRGLGPVRQAVCFHWGGRFPPVPPPPPPDGLFPVGGFRTTPTLPPPFAASNQRRWFVSSRTVLLPRLHLPAFGGGESSRVAMARSLLIFSCEARVTAFILVLLARPNP